MPDSKYQCLADAVKETGIKLPPITLETDVQEKGGSTNDVVYSYQIQGRSPDEPYEISGAIYPGLQNFAMQTVGLDRGPPMGWVVPPTAEAPGVYAVVNTNTGGETIDRESTAIVEPGTVARTIERLLKCRDPSIS